MSQDFRPHTIHVNYEASPDGVVRNYRLKKPVGIVNSHGYLLFGAGKKKYLCHRKVYECHKGLIKDGFVIDQIDSNPRNNALSNLQCITESENLRKGKNGKCSKQSKSIKSFDETTHEERIFQSMNAAGNYFDICTPSVRYVAENITKSAYSKRFKNRIQFSYI